MEITTLWHVLFLFVAFFGRMLLNTVVYYRLHRYEIESGDVMSEMAQNIWVTAYAAIVPFWLRYQGNTIVFSVISTLLAVLSLVSLGHLLDIELYPKFR